MLCRTKILSLALRLLYLSAWCLVATLPSARTQGVVSSDLSKLRSVGGVALSPDGRHLAYSVVMRDEPGRPYGQLWMMELTTQKSIRFGGDKDRGGGVVAGRGVDRLFRPAGRPARPSDCEARRLGRYRHRVARRHE